MWKRARPMNPLRNKLTKSTGMLLLSIYLILVGLIGLFHINLGELSFITPLVALVAGVFLLIGR